MNASNGTLLEVVASTLAPQKEEPRICDPGGGGLILPLGGESEANWNPRIKVVLYGVGLVYCFLGISIVADQFMAAIERITSSQKKVRVPNTDPPRFMTVQVWNETVANLTLMALGSSAPEILLATNEIFKNEFFEGKLGPSTIVGSAAFNLFVIIAVCINSIPNGEVRYIKETNVFYVTAVFSLFAYIWLLYIVQINSLDIIEPWEGIVTFLYFFVLVLISWMTDVGYFEWGNIKFCMFWLANPRQRSQDEDEDEEDWSPKLCCRSWLGLCGRGCCFGFAALCRLCKSCFKGKRAADVAEGEMQTSEEATEMVLKAFDPQADILDDGGDPIDFEAGIMTFSSETLYIDGGFEEREHTLTVYRKNGTRGRFNVKYTMVQLTAIPGFDYEEEEGELLFRDGMTSVDLVFKILPKRQGEKNDKFQIVIEDESETLMFNPYHDGGEEKNLMTVYIINENPVPITWRDKIYAVCDSWLNMDEIALGHQAYKDQIVEAFWVNGSREDQDEAGPMDWFNHLIWVPWTLSFNLFTPPPTYLGGWVCFVMSLLGIGVLTIIVGDLAELFGCAFGIEDAITAITIVAMGTSVPDLFASKAAATGDEYADASIVNVTGSNSVNVFLGIGLPWMAAAVYWNIAGANEKWTRLYATKFEALIPLGDAEFIVSSGQLFFSVMVFTVAAVVCLTVIIIRRRVFGGELGGPSDPKAYSSFLLITLWFYYVSLSIWKLMSKEDQFDKQIIAIVCGLVVVAVLLVLFAIGLRALKISKGYIGEEGFWGLFVALAIIVGRIGVYFGIQYQW